MIKFAEGNLKDGLGLFYVCKMSQKSLEYRVHSLLEMLTCCKSLFDRLGVVTPPIFAPEMLVCTVLQDIYFKSNKSCQVV